MYAFARPRTAPTGAGRCPYVWVYVYLYVYNINARSVKNKYGPDSTVFFSSSVCSHVFIFSFSHRSGPTERMIPKPPPSSPPRCRPAPAGRVLLILFVHAVTYIRSVARTRTRETPMLCTRSYRRRTTRPVRCRDPTEEPKKK